MKYNMFVVRDVLSGQCGVPRCEFNEATAKRSFADMIRNNFNKGDYELYYVGQFDCLTGSIVDVQFSFICNGSSFSE